MVKEDIVFGKTANDLENIAPRERATKNHPGGLRENEDNSQAVMCEWPNNPERCPRNIWKSETRTAQPCGRSPETTAPANLMKATRCVLQCPFGEKHLEKIYSAA